MFPLLFVLFILVPIAELYVIIQVGQEIGALWTIALLIADSILGAMLLRSQSRAAWRRFNEQLAAGRMPGKEIADGAMIIFGGALLITPGFLSDILGILLLLPPTRAVLRGWILRRAVGRVTFGVMGTPQAVPRTGRSRQRQDYDVEGTATDREPPELDR